MKTKLIIATGAFALYGMGFLCAALDTAEAAEAAPAAEAVMRAGAATDRAAEDGTTCTAGIRGIALEVSAA